MEKSLVLVLLRSIWQCQCGGFRELLVLYLTCSLLYIICLTYDFIELINAENCGNLLVFYVCYRGVPQGTILGHTEFIIYTHTILYC